MVTKESVRLDLNYPPTPVGGIADLDEDAACRLDLNTSTHFRGLGFQTASVSAFVDHLPSTGSHAILFSLYFAPEFAA